MLPALIATLLLRVLADQRFSGSNTAKAFVGE